ncbi:MAG TPA: hypothetical protein VMP38_00440 [Candidatus Acidoferrum sp.]|jgi:hypothetical protein|nr:hypothetical protein [Candidatus Acidoferrum sp.]
MTPTVALVSTAVREALSSSYEDLRRVVIAGADRQGCGVGLALFTRSGMARWMDTCIDMLTRSAAAPAPRRHVEEPLHLDPDVRIEVAMVLAQMALSAHAQGATI